MPDCPRGHEITDRVRRDETGQIGDRVDQTNAAGGCRAGQERGRERPEDRHRAKHANPRDRQHRECKHWMAKRGAGQGYPAASDDRGDGAVKASLARFVLEGMALT